MLYSAPIFLVVEDKEFMRVSKWVYKSQGKIESY